jgi:septal ring factor EnvC (AmiA/AmiB activator)
VADRVRAAVPWLLIAASAVLAVLVLYVVFAGFLPAKERAEGLEAELRALYGQEAKLHERLAQMEQQQIQREAQLRALRAERDELARRVAELEQRLGVGRRGPPR